LASLVFVGVGFGDGFSVRLPEFDDSDLDL